MFTFDAQSMIKTFPAEELEGGRVALSYSPIPFPCLYVLGYGVPVETTLDREMEITVDGSLLADTLRATKPRQAVSLDPSGQIYLDGVKQGQEAALEREKAALLTDYLLKRPLRHFHLSADRRGYTYYGQRPPLEIRRNCVGDTEGDFSRLMSVLVRRKGLIPHE